MISTKLQTDVKYLMQNICEETEFVLANFYVPSSSKEDAYMTCKGMPNYIIDSNDTKLVEFQQFCQEQKYAKGEEVIGDVWDTQKYEWVENVMRLPSDAYRRKFRADSANLKTCLIISFTQNEEFIGLMEFFLTEEWIELPKLVQKLSFYSFN